MLPIDSSQDIHFLNRGTLWNLGLSKSALRLELRTIEKKDALEKSRLDRWLTLIGSLGESLCANASTEMTRDRQRRWKRQADILGASAIRSVSLQNIDRPDQNIRTNKRTIRVIA